MSKETMTCTVEIRDRTAVISLFGGLLVTGIVRVSEALHSARARGVEQVVFSLEHVTALDRPGFTFLQAVQRYSGKDSLCPVLIQGLPEGLLEKLDLKETETGIMREWSQPFAPEPPREQAAPVTGAPPEPDPKVWILVVDDEPLVLTYLATCLGHANYRVLQAPSAARAHQLMEEWPGQVQLALVDYQLGRVSGLKLAEDLVKMEPGLKIILMSGQPSEFAQGASANPAIHRWLDKPLFGEKLLQAIREVLQEASSE